MRLTWSRLCFILYMYTLWKCLCVFIFFLYFLVLSGFYGYCSSVFHDNLATLLVSLNDDLCPVAVFFQPFLGVKTTP